MKYKLFRSPGDLDKAVRKHELVAVETGKNIDDVVDALIRAVRDDLAECRNMRTVRPLRMHRSRFRSIAA